MHFEFRHSSCTGGVHQHRAVLGHHGFKFFPFSQTIRRMASAPSIPKEIFEYMTTLAFLTKKNAKLPESQRLESSDHTRVTQHRYLSSTMNLSTKQNGHYRTQAASWSTGRLGIGCNDLPKITSSSKRCAFCGGILAPARIHIAGIPWKTEPTGVMAKGKKGMMCPKWATKNSTCCPLVKRLISSKKGARSKRSRSAINKQLWESCKPYLMCLRRLTWTHTECHQSGSQQVWNKQPAPNCVFILVQKNILQLQTEAFSQDGFIQQHPSPSCCNSDPVHHAFTGNDTALK